MWSQFQLVLKIAFLKLQMGSFAQLFFQGLVGTYNSLKSNHISLNNEALQHYVSHLSTFVTADTRPQELIQLSQCFVQIFCKQSTSNSSLIIGNKLYPGSSDDFFHQFSLKSEILCFQTIDARQAISFAELIPIDFSVSSVNPPLQHISISSLQYFPPTFRHTLIDLRSFFRY